MPKRILLVDDDPAMRQIGQRVLRIAGYEATAVGKLSHATEELSNTHFNLLILDGSLEKPRDGFRYARELATRGLDNPPPVLLVSAERETEPGFERLYKPVANDELVAKVRAMIGDP